MNKHNLFTMILSFILFVPLTSGEEIETIKTNKDAFKLPDWLTVKQALSGPKAGIPATLSYINPNSGDSTYIINAAIKISPSFLTYSNLQIAPFIAYNKDTTITKPVDTLFTGLNLEYVLGEPYNIETEEPQLAMFAQGTVAYGDKKEDDIETLLYKANISPLHGGYGLGSTTGIMNNTHRLLWGTVIGLEYESVVDTNEMGTLEKDDSVVRLPAELSVQLLPYYYQLGGLLGINLRYAYWYELNQKGGFDDDNDSQNLFTAMLNLYLDNKQTVGLSIIYEDGEMPTLSSKDQSSVKIGLTIKHQLR